MRKHRYRGLMSTINYNICGDGYDADERANAIFEKATKLIDKGYQQGRADAIEQILPLIKDIRDLCRDDVLIDLIEKVEKLKEQK